MTDNQDSNTLVSRPALPSSDWDWDEVGSARYVGPNKSRRASCICDDGFVETEGTVPFEVALAVIEDYQLSMENSKKKSDHADAIADVTSRADAILSRYIRKQTTP